MKLYLTLEDDYGHKTEKTMFVDETTVGRYDIYAEAVEEMFEILNGDNKDVYPTPLEVDLSPNDEVFGGNN